MKKKFTVIALLSAIVLQSTCASAATMYSLDGRTLEVDVAQIDEYRQVGWYYGKPVTMYSLVFPGTIGKFHWFLFPSKGRTA